MGSSALRSSSSLNTSCNADINRRAHHLTFSHICTNDAKTLAVSLPEDCRELAIELAEAKQNKHHRKVHEAAMMHTKA